MAADETRPAKSARAPFLHMPVPWVFVLGYLIGVGLQVLFPVAQSETGWSTALRIAGGCAVVAGFSVAGWAWMLFQRAGTSRVPGESSRVLVTRGPYRFTRNPMYVGLTTAYIGEAGALLQIWPLCLLLVVLAYVNWFVIPVEEATLASFAGYERYRAHVRRWI